MDDIATQLSDAQAQCERCPNCCHCDLHQNAIDEILRLRERQRELLDRIHRLNEDLLEWQDKDRRRLLNERYGN